MVNGPSPPNIRSPVSTLWPGTAIGSLSVPPGPFTGRQSCGFQKVCPALCTSLQKTLVATMSTNGPRLVPKKATKKKNKEKKFTVSTPKTGHQQQAPRNASSKEFFKPQPGGMKRVTAIPASATCWTFFFVLWSTMTPCPNPQSRRAAA